MDNLVNGAGEKQVVIFVHVPKTAGTTLRHVVQYQFQPNNVFEFYQRVKKPHKGIDEFRNLSEARKESLKLVSGHIGFGLHEFLFQPCTYITVLRDPVDRVISYYYYLLNTKNGAAKNKSLEDFVQTYRGAQNSMTKFLSGMRLEIQLLDSNVSLDYEQCFPETLELAKNNLKKYFVVTGLVERFDETLILLKRALGWNIPPYYFKTNVSKSRSAKDNISKEALDLIEKFNEFDIQLYEYAKEKFEELVSRQDSSFVGEIQDLKLANELSKPKFFFKLYSSFKRLNYRTYEALESFYIS